MSTTAKSTAGRRRNETPTNVTAHLHALLANDPTRQYTTDQALELVRQSIPTARKTAVRSALTTLARENAIRRPRGGVYCGLPTPAATPPARRVLAGVPGQPEPTLATPAPAPVVSLDAVQLEDQRAVAAFVAVVDRWAAFGAPVQMVARVLGLRIDQVTPFMPIPEDSPLPDIPAPVVAAVEPDRPVPQPVAPLTPMVPLRGLPPGPAGQSVTLTGTMGPVELVRAVATTYGTRWWESATPPERDALLATRTGMTGHGSMNVPRSLWADVLTFADTHCVIVEPSHYPLVRSGFWSAVTRLAG